MLRTFILRFMVFVALWTLARQVQAQSPDTTPTPAPQPEAAASDAPAPAPVVEPAASAPTAPTVPTVQAPAAQPTPKDASVAICLVGETIGVKEGDSITAAALVCEALRQQGARVDGTPMAAGAAQGSSAYRVSLQPLGKILLLEVRFESPIGTTVESRTLQLGKIEEIPVAARRVAESMIKGTPLEQTAKMNTLVGEETRVYQKRHGELSIGVGVFGFGAINSDVTAGYGLYGQLLYEVLRYGVGAEIRVGGSGYESGDATLTSVGLSGRYFFLDGDITPFVGGGFGVLWLSDRDTDAARASGNDFGGEFYYGDDMYEGSGVAAHLDVGVELLRMHDVRFDALLRVDVPLFVLHPVDPDIDQRYAVPVSLMASFSFQ